MIPQKEKPLIEWLLKVDLIANILQKVFSVLDLKLGFTKKGKTAIFGLWNFPRNFLKEFKLKQGKIRLITQEATLTQRVVFQEVQLFVITCTLLKRNLRI